MTEDHPCRIDAPHAPHTWYAVIEDPETPRTLHLFNDHPLTCPGITAEAWLAGRDTTPPPEAH